MFKDVHDKIWIFDVEWIPDVQLGKVLYKLPAEASDLEVMNEMWSAGGATEANPMPYLKTTVCRVVSIAAVIREVVNGEVQLKIHSIPDYSAGVLSEKELIERFLHGFSRKKGLPQLVGYNLISADLKIIVQRAIVNRVQATDFAMRPNKPWEGADYFSDFSESTIDLMKIVGGGKSTPSLNEIATACGIPGKFESTGEGVAQFWLQGEYKKIVDYNEFDAITTYLLWLRIAYFGGFLTLENYEAEEKQMRVLLEEESKKPERKHLLRYLEEWNRLSAAMSK